MQGALPLDPIGTLRQAPGIGVTRGGPGTCAPGSQKKEKERKRGKGEKEIKKRGEKEVTGMTYLCSNC